jgi:predicted RNase H-like HicB family nuclease
MAKKKRVRRINASLPVTIIQEDNKFIAYTPALDISTYGNSFEEAKRRFAELVNIFFEELCDMGTLEEVLEECGWKRTTTPKKTWIPPMIENTTETIKVPCPV